MGRPSLQVRLLLCAASALLFLQCADSAIDNVAVQWNTFLTSLICKHGIFFNDANSNYSQMHLAQWHALAGNPTAGAITREGAGYSGFPACTPGPEIGRRHYASLEAAVEEAKLARMNAGHHFNVSVTHGAEIGALVAKFVPAHWSLPQPSGVTPDPSYLSAFARLPARVPDFSPITLNID